MAHTLPPWTSKWRMATIFGQIDQGELAARLGSINTFDRRGDTVWMDDFEDSSLKWDAYTSGSGGSISLDNTRARNGDQSCKMVPGSGANFTAYMYNYIPLPVGSNLGFECSFTGHVDISYILLNVKFHDGNFLKECGLALSFTTDKLYYYKDPTPTWIEFQDGWAPFAHNYLFSTAKLVFNSRTTDYIRALVNDKPYNLSPYDYYSTGSGVNPYVAFAITITNSKAGNPAIYIDDVIFTQNEP